jgi:hypothetical protein
MTEKYQKKKIAKNKDFIYFYFKKIFLKFWSNFLSLKSKQTLFNVPKPTSSKWKGFSFFLFFFGGTGVWTQNLSLYHLIHNSSTFCFSFSFCSDRVTNIFPGQPHTVILLPQTPK